MKKFKSTTGQEVYVALTTGHCTIIGTDWTDLHERFHTAAYSQGCISDDMIKNTSGNALDPSVVNMLNNVALQKNEVEDAIRKLVKENDLEAFDSKGKPKCPKLTDMVGFRVTNAVRDEVWYRIQEQSNDAA